MKPYETTQRPLGKGEVGGSIPPGSTINNVYLIEINRIIK